MPRPRRRTSEQRQAEPFYALIPALIPVVEDSCNGRVEPDGGSKDTKLSATGLATPDMARSFERVSCDSDAFERLGRYEMRLWRQAVQTILLLNSINRGAKDYANDQYFGLRNMPPKGRRVLWPPFVVSD